jgi:glycosyltransferase involved in cell wall biosynthesis
MKKPLVSVLMPNYNCENYLPEAIESILNQTYRNFEFIIVDDSSTDNSWKIIQDYVKKDKRIRAFRNEKNSGVTVTLNNGLKHCKGEFIARMDSDDFVSSSRFERQISLLERKNADICSTNLCFVSSNGAIIGKRNYSDDISKVIFFESPICHASVLMKKELFDKFGVYNNSFNSAEDYDLWFRFYSNGAKFVLLKDYSYFYRQHGNTVKQLKTKKQIKTTVVIKKNAMKTYGLKFPFTAKLRIYAEQLLSYMPKQFILLLFYLVKRK